MSPSQNNISDKTILPKDSINNSKSVPQSMKMLLVEDSTLLREVLFETINNLDNVTVSGTADTQHRAIELLDQAHYDILLLDIELAQGNGFEVIRHTQKAHYPFGKPILMMLTNHAHPHYRSLAKSLGVQYFFDKSMDFDLAIEAIELEADRFSNAQH
ncbi:MAG: response regulator [Pseudomonadota bacterium]